MSDGRHLSAVQLQWEYFEHAKKYVEREDDTPENQEVLTRWESVRDADEFQRTLRPGRRKLFRFGANLLMLMGDYGDKAEPLAGECARGVKYWAGE